jgi:hypothetical protein
VSIMWILSHALPVVCLVVAVVVVVHTIIYIHSAFFGIKKLR